MKRNNFLIFKYFNVCILTAAATLLTSCSDFLEIEPRNEIVEEQYWSDKADVEAVIAGCYIGMQADAVVRRMIIWGECRSDNVVGGDNVDDDPNLQNVLKENINAQNGYTSWGDFYSVINRCNTVIKKAPAVAAVDPAYTESELKAHLAEMAALRDLCYFYLIRTFQNVPYTTEAFTDDDQKMDLPATAFDVVLDSLISDLRNISDNRLAIVSYPETQPLYQTGRITLDAVNAMLCEMYLWKKDYANCIVYADKVIDAIKERVDEQRKRSNTYGSASDDDSRYNGFPLTSESMGTNGYFGNAYTTNFGTDGNSQEIIFQLIFDDDPRGNSMPANSAVNVLYGHATVDRGYLAPSTYVLDDVSTSTFAVYAKSNKKYDARNFENCHQRLSAINKFTTRSLTITASKSTDPECTYGAQYTDGQNGSNWVIYRLTDIMLLKAEALAMQMKEGSDADVVAYNLPLRQQAFALVNAVNKRAVCETTTELTDTLRFADYASKSQMETLVMQERQRELMFEGKRWYDLVRQSLRNGNPNDITTAALKKVTTNSGLIQNFLSNEQTYPGQLFWPYNYDEEYNVNKNLQATHNPAFGSGKNSNIE
ncbi:MAG: RagB/SusD family nutrient uptake outer membrane protein [Prevotella sp.]|nr:RagB/SusD family nutrient uptake outer membrane protein [Prevotella sp.]